MRLAAAAGTLYLGLLLFAVSAATSQTTTPAPAPIPVAPASAPPSSDAAAKHAKRTACLKQAKDQKLVNEQKSAFLKDCIGAP
jgi:hypothetical protein